jgi:DeoR family fructose operon transcriptional repressor
MAVTGTLDAESRRSAMTRELHDRGTLQLGETAERWNVHPMTVRRDFDAFVLAGVARRVRGGVVALDGDDFAQRRHRHATAKRRIARKLLDLVRPGDAIALDSSTTVHALAETLGGERVSIVTNGFGAFQTVHGREGVKAYLTGGERDETNLSLVGSLAVQAVQQFSLDACFLSAMSVDPAFGTSELTLEQVEVKRAMADAARTVVLAVDSSKFATRARFRSLSLSDFDVLVTELDPADERLDPYRGEVGEIR